MDAGSGLEGWSSAVRVAFIAGTSWSGSTLLEQALAQIDGCVSVGELYWLWNRDWPQMVCECGDRFGACTFWQSVLREAYGPEPEAVREEIAARSHGFLRHSIAPTLARASTMVKPSAAFAELGSMVEPVYRAVVDATGASTVVDASKSGLWGLAISRATGVELRLVHLVRDPVGFAASDGRSRRVSNPAGATRSGRRPARSLLTWMLLNLEAELLKSRVAGNLLVLYEDFARAPSATARRVADVVGLDGAAQVFVQNNLIVRRTGHAIGGNLRRPKLGKTPIAPGGSADRTRPGPGRLLRGAVSPLWDHYRREARA